MTRHERTNLTKDEQATADRLDREQPQLSNRGRRAVMEAHHPRLVNFRVWFVREEGQSRLPVGEQDGQ